ncbi:MAG TPA: hypothetical protein VGK73_13545, partial [Polyangiaceae bacterium]
TVVATAALAALVLAPSVLRLRPYGVAITPELWSEFPEAGPWGRFDAADRPPFPPLPEAAVKPLLATLAGAGEPVLPVVNAGDRRDIVALGLVLLALGAWIPLSRRRPEARRLWSFFAAVAACHAVALVAGLRLFIPERYVAYGAPVLALIVVPCALGALADAGRSWLRSLPVVYNAALLALIGARGVPWSGLTVAIPPAEVPLYAAIRALPPNAVVAGFPGEAIDNVPYLTRRAAFVTRETQMPFHTQFTLRQRERTRAFLRGYFASSDGALRDFRDRTHVTHLLVDRRHFTTRPTYFAPFDPDVARAFDETSRHGSAALASSPRTQVFAAGSLVLLDLARL